MSERRDGLLLRLRQVHRHFITPSQARLPIIAGLDLELRAGEVVAITGESGVGKSTLLNLCGLLDRPSAGSIEIDGADSSALAAEQVAMLRNRFIGFIFQFHHLLPEFSALENVLMPAMILGTVGAEQDARARRLLDDVGVGSRADHSPATLSGGERQRVALARALMNRPSLVLADEPTGNLDPATAAAVQEVLFETVRRAGRSMILVTHDRALAARADRRLVLVEGALRPLDAAAR